MSQKGVSRFSVSLKNELLSHLDQMVMEKGYSNRSLADRLIGAKGVKHGKLALTSTGTDLPA